MFYFTFIFCFLTKKGPVASTAGPFVYLDVSTRLTSHDLLNLEQRHHHAVDAFFFIFLLLFFIFRLQKYIFSVKLQTFSHLFFSIVIFLGVYILFDLQPHRLVPVLRLHNLVLQSFHSQA